MNILNLLPTSAYYAFFGGLAINCIRVAELANVRLADRPATFNDPFFLFQFFILPIIGGGLGLAYQASGSNLTPLVAINIGAAAPLILKSLAAAIPPVGPKKTD